MRKPKRRVFSRAEMQAEIEQLSRDRYEQQVRADKNDAALRAAYAELEQEKRLRRAAEESSAHALRAQRVAEARLAGLLDRYLALARPSLPATFVSADFASDFEANRGVTPEQAAYGGACGGGKFPRRSPDEADHG